MPERWTRDDEKGFLCSVLKEREKRIAELEAENEKLKEFSDQQMGKYLDLLGKICDAMQAVLKAEKWARRWKRAAKENEAASRSLFNMMHYWRVKYLQQRYGTSKGGAENE